jgi:hypothetical protein
MSRSRVVLVLAILLGATIGAALVGGLTLLAQPRGLIGGSYMVSAKLDVNGTPTSALLLATFTSDGKVLASDETLFGFDQAAAAACGFVDVAAGGNNAAVRFGSSHGAWSFTPQGALWTTFALGDVNGRRVFRRARGIGQEFFASHGGPVVIDFFDPSDRNFELPLCAFHGHWEASRIQPMSADFGQ